MTRKFSLVIEGDPTGYSAYVPELPTILVTGRSVEELTTRAAEAIRLYRRACSARRAQALELSTSTSNALLGKMAVTSHNAAFFVNDASLTSEFAIRSVVHEGGLQSALCSLSNKTKGTKPHGGQSIRGSVPGGRMK